jgi:hypothetical protein
LSRYLKGLEETPHLRRFFLADNRFRQTVDEQSSGGASLLANEAFNGFAWLFASKLAPTGPRTHSAVSFVFLS